MNSAKSVKKLRLSLCLEQSELAKEVGIHAATIKNYERGLRRPRMPVIRKLLELAKKNDIKMSVEDFLEDI